MSDAFNDHVEALRALLPRIRKANLTDASDAGRTFLWHVYEIGRAITLDPALASTPRLVDLIADSAESLHRRSLVFGEVYGEATDLLDGFWDWGEEWVRVCRDWSAGRFLRALWSGTTFADELDYFADDDEYLDALRAKGDEYGPVAEDERPSGIPSSHWWWWYPDPPPVSR